MPSPADSDPTDEMLIVGNLRARLLGFPLLTIDVRFAVGPDASLPTPVGVGRRIARRRRRGGLRHRQPRSERRPSPPGRRLSGSGRRLSGSDGARLARSAQLVREATTALDEAAGNDAVPRTG